jgi:hypothetical protein
MHAVTAFGPGPAPKAAIAAIAATAALGLLLLSAGCTSLAARPASGGQLPLIAGDWQREEAGSDNFDAKLAVLMKERQQRLRARRGLTGGGARRGGAEQGGGRSSGDMREIDVLELPQEESERFRSRMIEDLRPPRILHISSEANGEAIAMTHDTEAAARRYLPGQTVSRIDDSGAAQIDCGWENQTLVVHAQYVHRATRSWRYEVDSATGMLLIRFEVNDPEIGRLNLTTRYRRQSL